MEPAWTLAGGISARGSKNAVTKHMVAAMLGDGPSTIRNAPEVGDVDITAAMLESLGFGGSRAPPPPHRPRGGRRRHPRGDAGGPGVRGEPVLRRDHDPPRHRGRAAGA